MTAVLFQAAAVAVTGTVCALLLRKQAGELGLLLAFATVCVILWLVLRRMQALLGLLRTLASLANVEEALVAPLLKTAVVSILTALTAGLARDAGESAIGTAVELAGAFVALCLSVPLVEAVLELMGKLM